MDLLFRDSRPGMDCGQRFKTCVGVMAGKFDLDWHIRDLKNRTWTHSSET